MRIARIPRPGALYYAAVAAQTFEAIEETVINPTDREEVVDVDVAKAPGAKSYSQMPGFWDFDRKFLKSANRVNVLKKIEGRYSANPF